MIERKPIPGYEGIYEADIFGKIYSIERTVKKSNGRIQPVPACERKSSLHGTGYRTIRLCKDGKAKTYRLHRIIALTFLPNPKNLSQVNHIDGDKNNNALFQSNGEYQLEWCDQDHNMTHASANGLLAFGERNKSTKLTSSMVAEALDRCLAGEWITDVAKEMGVRRNTLRLAFYKTSRAQEWRDSLSRRCSAANAVKNKKAQGISK